METLFPFGFPWPTAMYLTLFIVTAAIYMVFMNYVLAGAIVLLVGYLAPGARRRVEGGPGGTDPIGTGVDLEGDSRLAAGRPRCGDHHRHRAAPVSANPVQTPVLYGEPAVIQPVHAALAGAHRGVLHALHHQEPRTGRAGANGARAGRDRGVRLFLLHRMGMDRESCLEPA